MNRTPLLLVTLLLTACGPTHFADPIVKMMDKDERHTTRWDAVAQAEKENYRDPRRIAALQKLTFESGYPVEYRKYAIDQLIAVDEPAAKVHFAKTIVLMNDFEARDYIIEQAVKRNWTDFIPALVRSYAQKASNIRDADRAERKALEKLAPGKPVEQTVLEVFSGSQKAEVTQRAAAWSLIQRLNPDRGLLMRQLAGMKIDDPMIGDLTAGAVELGVVPDSIETVAWLRMLRTAPYASFWGKAKAVVARLNDEQRQNLQLRHLPVLVYLAERNDPILTRSRDQLLSEAIAHDDAAQHHTKGPTFDGPMDEVSQNLRFYQKQLCWADLAVIRTLEQIMADKTVTAAWFQQADMDEKDKSTEYGGLLRVADNGQAVPQLYKPEYRRNDLHYYPPAQLVTDAYIALAHYHFHAQSLHNRRYAGPGRGDMERIADRQQFNGLVLTFIDENSLNVDYYQPGRALVDLGTIHR
jgi:hypothetical protein